MSDRDYYELLGLTPRADGAMVDQAYWHLARKYQMLAVTNPRARSMLDELNEAYGVLGNPRLREQYDAFRDDVLIRKGMIQPVTSKPKRSKAPSPEREKRESSGSRRRLRMPSLAVKLPKLARDDWGALGASAIIFALAVSGAWTGVNAIFVLVALALGLAMALTPVLRRQLSEINVSLPAVNVPRIEMPKLPDINVQRLRDAVPTPRDEPLGTEQLRQSTAAMISRWRNSVGLPQDPADDGDREPSTRLVEIVETERKIDESEEPLAAVMDILRGSGSNSVRSGEHS